MSFLRRLGRTASGRDDLDGAAPEIARSTAGGPELPAGPVPADDPQPGASALPSPESANNTLLEVAGPPVSLDAGVARSRSGFISRLRGLLGGAVDEGTWDEIEETLISADVGAGLAGQVVVRARKRAADLAGTPAARAEAAVRAELAATLRPRDPDVDVPDSTQSPSILLVVGVNGTGKTTSIGKLAFRFRADDRSVLLAAGDTFRAAASEQLAIWAERAGASIVAHAPGADPAAVVYDAIDAAVARGIDVVIADTAGRLHTKSNLMDELAKIRRVIDRRLPGARPEVLFVLDATTGQNGLAQARAFHDAVGLTGIVLTKLDSTARGGIVFAIEQSLGVPVQYVGVGEGPADLLVFDPAAFVAALFG